MDPSNDQASLNNALQNRRDQNRVGYSSPRFSVMPQDQNLIVDTAIEQQQQQDQDRTQVMYESPVITNENLHQEQIRQSEENEINRITSELDILANQPDDRIETENEDDGQEQINSQMITRPGKRLRITPIPTTMNLNDENDAPTQADQTQQRNDAYEQQDYSTNTLSNQASSLRPLTHRVSARGISPRGDNQEDNQSSQRGNGLQQMSVQGGENQSQRNDMSLSRAETKPEERESSDSDRSHDSYLSGDENESPDKLNEPTPQPVESSKEPTQTSPSLAISPNQPSSAEHTNQEVQQPPSQPSEPSFKRKQSIIHTLPINRVAKSKPQFVKQEESSLSEISKDEDKDKEDNNEDEFNFMTNSAVQSMNQIKKTRESELVQEKEFDINDERYMKAFRDFARFGYEPENIRQDPLQVDLDKLSFLLGRIGNKNKVMQQYTDKAQVFFNENEEKFLDSNANRFDIVNPENLTLRELDKLSKLPQPPLDSSDEEEEDDDKEPSVCYGSIKNVMSDRFDHIKMLNSSKAHKKAHGLWTGVVGSMRRGALIKETTSLDKLKEENPEWINNIMQENKSFGKFCSYCFQILTCRIFSKAKVQPIENNKLVRDSTISQDQDEEKLIELEKLEQEEERKRELQARYCPQSLSHYELDNPTRLFFISVIENVWFDRSIITLIAVNSIFLGMIDYTWNGEGEKPLGNMLADESEIYFTIFFTMECVSKIVAMGVIFHEKCYLRDGWNWLDFIVVITSLIQSIPGMSNVSSLRTFRLFRPLRSLSAFPAMRVLVSTLFQSFTQLANILILDMFVILTFSLFGLQMWGGIIHYRCRTTPHPVDGDWTVVEGDYRVCGAFHQCQADSHCGSLYVTEFKINGTLQKFELNEDLKQNLDRDSILKEFNFGVTNFDNIFSSYLTIFQCTTLEGWFSVMKMMQDGYGVMFSSVFFVMVVIICSYFLLNLTVAIMLDNFKQLNGARTASFNEQYEYNRHRVKLLKDLDSALGRTSYLTVKKEKLWIQTFCAAYCCRYPGHPLKKKKAYGYNRYNNRCCLYAWMIIKQPIFNHMIMLAIILNTIQLAMDRYPEPEPTIFNDSNLFFTILFASESLLKIFGLTTEKFMKDNFNTFDLIIVLASILELMFSSSNKGIISSARAFRLARLFKLARSNHTLKCLLDSITQTISAITYFMVLLMLFIYVFALLGMTMFAGTFKFDKDGYYDPTNGELPRKNFDNLYWSVITVFQIMVGDEWNQVMYMAIQSEGGSLAVLYFVGLVLLGNFIMLNLFLSILLGNFEIASLIIRGRHEDKVLKNFEKRIVWKDDYMSRQFNKQQLKSSGKLIENNNDSESEQFHDDSDGSSANEDQGKRMERKGRIESLTRDYQDFIEAVQKEQDSDYLGTRELTKQDMAKGFMEFRMQKRNDNESDLFAPFMGYQDQQDNQFFVNNPLMGSEDSPVKVYRASTPMEGKGLQLTEQKQSNQHSQEKPKENNHLISELQSPQKIEPDHLGNENGGLANQGKNVKFQSNKSSTPLFQSEEIKSVSTPMSKKSGLLQVNMGNLKLHKIQSSNVDDKNQSPLAFVETDRSLNLVRTPDGQKRIAQDQMILRKTKSQELNEDKNEAANDNSGSQKKKGANLLNNLKQGMGLVSPAISKTDDKQYNEDQSQLSANQQPQDSSFNSDIDLAQIYAAKAESKVQKLNKKVFRLDKLRESVKSKTQRIERQEQQRPELKVITTQNEQLDTARPLFTQASQEQEEIGNPDNMPNNNFLSPKRPFDIIETDSQALKLNTDLNNEQDLSGDNSIRGQAIDYVKVVVEYMSESSLFFLHRDNSFRKFLIRLTMKKFVVEIKDESKEDVMNEIGGGDGEDSEDSHNAAQKSLVRSNAKNLDMELQMQFGTAVYSKETFEEMQNRLKAEQEAKENDNIKSSNSNSNEDSHSESSSSEAAEYQFTLNKPNVRRQFEEIIKNNGKEHELDRVLRQEYQKKTFVIHQGSQSVGPRAALKHQKQLEKDHSEMKDLLEAYKQRLSMQNKYNQVKLILQSTFPFLNWTLNTWFENTIYFFIGLAMILLMVDNPSINPNGYLKRQLNAWDTVVSLVFLLEAGVRIMASGFFKSSIPGKKGYIMNGQNRIDFAVSMGVDTTIYIGSTFQLWDPAINEILNSFKVLRCLRALRPLKQIAKTESLRLAIGSLFTAMPAIGNGLVVCSLIIFIYAILGVNLFKGKFYHCAFDPTQGLDIDYLLEKVDTKDDCLRMGGVWQNKPRNFDSILGALPLLLEIITTEGWLEVMYTAIDARGIDLQPKKNYNEFAAIFFVSYLIIGNIFILNLFVGIVIDKYNRLKDKMNGFLLMTRDQRMWIDQDKQMSRIILEPKKPPPENEIQLQAFEICNDVRFENFINLCIMLSTLQLATRYYLMDKTFENSLDILGILLTLIYNIEALIKLIAYDQQYFSTIWNKFDLTIVVIADLALLGEIQVLKESEFFKFLKVLKGLRILRVFRLIRVSKNLMILTESLMIILPRVVNVGGLILLLFFMFGVIGNNMFSKVIHQTEINQNNNFESFGMSINLLMRCTTGEGWNKIMHELAINPSIPIYRELPDGTIEVEYCLMKQTYEQLMKDGPKECGSKISYIYFGIFIVIIQLLMLNLFIAVVIEGFGSVNKEHTGAVTHKDYMNFLDAWLCFDYDATGWIELEDVIYFIFILEKPLGSKGVINEKFVDLLITRLERKMAAKGQIADHKDKYFVNKEHNLIIPFSRAREELVRLNMPVFKTESVGKYKCHISHVLKRLTFLAFQKQNPDFDPYGIESHHLLSLKNNWEMQYPELTKVKQMAYMDTGRMFCGLFIAQQLKKIVNAKKFNDKDIAYNWRAKDLKDKAAEEAKNRKDEVIKKIHEQKAERQRKKQKALERKKRKQGDAQKSPDSPSKSQELISPGHPKSVQNNLEKESPLEPGSAENQRASQTPDKKLSKDQIKKMKLKERLERDEDRRREELEKNYQMDSVFTQYIIEEILINGDKFQQLKVGRQALIERDRKIRMQKGHIFKKDIIEILARGLSGSLSRANFIHNEKKIQDGQPHWTDPRQDDGQRSTWWCTKSSQNHKFINWMRNELIRESIYKLIEAGVLDRSATDKNIEVVIEELVNKIFEEQRNSGESDTDEKRDDTIRLVKEQLEIMRKNAFNRRSSSHMSSKYVTSQSERSHESVDLLGTEILKEFGIKSAAEIKQEKLNQQQDQENLKETKEIIDHRRSTFGPNPNAKVIVTNSEVQSEDKVRPNDDKMDLRQSSSQMSQKQQQQINIQSLLRTSKDYPTRQTNPFVQSESSEQIHGNESNMANNRLNHAKNIQRLIETVTPIAQQNNQSRPQKQQYNIIVTESNNFEEQGEAAGIQDQMQESQAPQIQQPAEQDKPQIQLQTDKK